MKKLIIVVLLLGFGMGLSAQGKKEQSGRVEAAKIGYISRSLNLTPEEAKSFWPIYDEYEAKKKEIQKAQRQHFQDSRIESAKGGTPNYEKVIKSHQDSKRAQLNLEIEYTDKLLKVIPAEKVFKLYKAERDFRSEIIEKVRERNNGDTKGRGGPNAKEYRR